MTTSELIKLCVPFIYTKSKNGSCLISNRGNDTQITLYVDAEADGSVRSESFTFKPSCLSKSFFNENVLNEPIKHIACSDNGIMEVYLGRVD